MSAISLLGCEVDFRFPIAKLFDWALLADSLESDSNPFAAFVLADLKTRETRNDLGERKAWKFRIVRSLYDRGFDREQIRQLFRLTYWIMQLPEP